MQNAPAPTGGQQEALCIPRQEIVPCRDSCDLPLDLPLDVCQETFRLAALPYFEETQRMHEEGHLNRRIERRYRRDSNQQKITKSQSLQRHRTAATLGKDDCSAGEHWNVWPSGAALSCSSGTALSCSSMRGVQNWMKTTTFTRLVDSAAPSLAGHASQETAKRVQIAPNKSLKWGHVREWMQNTKSTSLLAGYSPKVSTCAHREEGELGSQFPPSEAIPLPRGELCNRRGSYAIGGFAGLNDITAAPGNVKCAP